MALLCGWPWAAGLSAAAPADSPHLWRPAPDNVYLQEIGRKIATPQPLTSVATVSGRVFAGGDAGLLELKGEGLVLRTTR